MGTEVGFAARRVGRDRRAAVGLDGEDVRLEGEGVDELGAFRVASCIWGNQLDEGHSRG